MALDAIISLERLLAPISDEKPSGDYLRHSGLYDQITEARRGEDDLAQGDWKYEIKKADWHKVLELCSEALAAKTKDLLVAAWLAEALVRIHGFPGLRLGLQILGGLLEKYWDTLHPANDDDDFTARANALRFVDRQLSLASKNLPITSCGGGADYSYLQWESSLQFDVPDNLEQLSYEERQRAEERQQLATAEGKVTGQQWRVAKSQTPRAFYEAIYQNLAGCREEFQRLDRSMDDKFGRRTPGLQTLKTSLNEIHSQIEKIVKEKRILEPDPVPVQESSGEPAEGMGGTASWGGTTGTIRSRTDALNRLREVAEFFRRTEPHSPISYLLERAINWGHMPFDIWLKEVIKNEEVLGHLRETLGIKTETRA